MRNGLSKKTKVAIWVTSFTLTVLAVTALVIPGLHPKAKIASHDTSTSFAAGRVTSGQNLGGAETLKAGTELKYQSEEVATTLPHANAIGVKWHQAGSEGEALIEVRTKSGNAWSNWTVLSGDDDRKDNAPAVHTAIALTNDASKVQYRFTLPPGVEIKAPTLTAIDATKGPDPTKKTLLSKIFGSKARAGATGPSIYTRIDWGCPEGDSSPRWGPEYRTPDEIVVHHTAATVSPSSSAAAVRAIWDFHANSNGWGDIGYNYLVDLNGNIFQGRFYNQSYARSINQDVVGGHTLNGHNYHSVGVATLGNFTDQGITGAMLDGVGKIAGWKAMPYGTWTPAGRTFGHRDFDFTNCPGNNLYNSLGTVRAIAGSYFDFYSKWQQFDYSYQGQGVSGSPGNALSLRPGETTPAYLDLKNEGTATWQQSQIHLGTSRPLDRASGFRDSSWLGANRPAGFTGRVETGGSVTPATTIAPGETARFAFTVGNQGAATGTYAEYFQPVAEGYTWFIRDMGIHWLMSSVGDVYSYQWITQTYGIPTEPNQTVTVRVDAKNTGNVDWHSDGANPIRLGASRPNDRLSNLRHSSWIGGGRPSTFTGRVETGGSVTPTTTIVPGETARFEFTAQSPNYPFVGNEYFNLVAEGKTWMNDVGMFWPVQIAQNYHVQWVGQSTYPTIVKSSNPVGSFYIDFKNTGTYTWQKNGVVRLGTSQPLDRASIFATFGLSGISSPALPADADNWQSSNRIGTFAGKVSAGSLDTGSTSIAPNETARFIVALDARTVSPGTYREYFRLVADGFAWLEDYGVFADVTVQP